MGLYAVVESKKQSRRQTSFWKTFFFFRGIAGRQNLEFRFWYCTVLAWAVSTEPRGTRGFCSLVVEGHKRERETRGLLSKQNRLFSAVIRTKSLETLTDSIVWNCYERTARSFNKGSAPNFEWFSRSEVILTVLSPELFAYRIASSLNAMLYNKLGWFERSWSAKWTEKELKPWHRRRWCNCHPIRTCQRLPPRQYGA